MKERILLVRSGPIMNGNCEKCGAAGAEEYSFWLGRKSGLDDVTRIPSGTTTRVVTTRHFKIGGTDSAFVCHRCLMRARFRRSARIVFRELLGIPIVAVIYGVALLVALGAAFGSSTHGTTWVWIVVPIPALAYVLVLAFNPPKQVGEQVAIQLHRDKLTAEGWSQFWTEREFAKLRPS